VFLEAGGEGEGGEVENSKVHTKLIIMHGPRFFG